MASRSDLYVTGIEMEGSHGWLSEASLDARILNLLVRAGGAALVMTMVPQQ